MTAVKVEISPGELIDRITILEIKAARIGDEAHAVSKPHGFRGRRVALRCEARSNLDPPDALVQRDEFLAGNLAVQQGSQAVLNAAVIEYATCLVLSGLFSP